MSLTVEVSLISGKTVSLQTHGEESVESLRVRAQKALGAGKGRLLDSTGGVIDGGAPLKKARMQDAEANAEPQRLTLQVRRVDICSGKCGGFAAILGDGSAVAWGNHDDGDDSIAVRDQLKNVQQIQATWGAFAAILGDGSVVIWGEADAGGDSSAVLHDLQNVQQIQATWGAFAAILGDGSVVTWGEADAGGDSSAVLHDLQNVQQIQATEGAFAAICGDLGRG